MKDYDFIWVGEAAKKALRYATEKPPSMEDMFFRQTNIPIPIEAEVVMEDDERSKNVLLRD